MSELAATENMRGFYTGLMGREADEAGLTFWSDLLALDVANGTTTVFEAFLASPEFQARWAALSKPEVPVIRAFAKDLVAVMKDLEERGILKIPALVRSYGALQLADLLTEAESEFRRAMGQLAGDLTRPRSNPVGWKPAIDVVWRKHRKALQNVGFDASIWPT